MQLRIGVELVTMFDARDAVSRAGMHLQRRLRSQDDPRTGTEANGLAEQIAGEDARAGRRDDDERGAMQIEGAADAKRRLGVRAPQHGRVAATLERQLEPGGASDRSGAADV